MSKNSNRYENNIEHKRRIKRKKIRKPVSRGSERARGKRYFNRILFDDYDVITDNTEVEKIDDSSN